MHMRFAFAQSPFAIAESPPRATSNRFATSWPKTGPAAPYDLGRTFADEAKYEYQICGLFEFGPIPLFRRAGRGMRTGR